MSDNINVEVKKKNPSIPPKNLRELTKQVSEIEGTIDDINESVEEAEQDVNEIKRAIDNSDDFVIRDNKFKRKNKAYNPAKYSGLGEIYLEKNETFLGREFNEFVTNVTVPDPTAIAETFEGLVYDRHRKEFLAYELVDGERVYYAEWIKFDKWESTDDYVPEAGYDFICEADDKAYRWTEETTPDLIETEAHYGNVLKQEMINLSNTIYHIQYDYDLIGKEITIPEGCLLEFEGGAISNGILVGQNTILVYNQPLNDILTATLEGTWRHESGVKADEEDITDTNGELKFKDKAYIPAKYSGLGRKYLRKNMVNGVNTLTQDMMSDANTIYIIQYDFILGENIIVPENCVLEFDEGSLANSQGNSISITGQDTGIKAGLIKILDVNVILAGNWKVKEYYPEWFGAKNDISFNSTTAFQKCLDICKYGGTVKISSGEFLLDTLYFKFGYNCHLEGNGTGSTILRMNSAPLITVENYTSNPGATDGSSYGNFSIRARDLQSDSDTDNVCIKHTRIRHGHIHDIDLLQGDSNNSKVYAFIELYGDFTYNTYIDRIKCNFGGYCKYGIKTTAKDNNVYNNSNIVNIHNCLFYNNSMEACIDMSCCTQYEIKGCLLESCGKHAIILGQAGDIRGNWIEDFTEQILVFQNNLGTVTSANNNIGENYFASSNNDIHVPAYCTGNSIKGMTLLPPAKVVKDTNSVNVYGLDVSEPTITANGSNTATKSAAVNNCGVWKLEYIVNLPTDQGISAGFIVCTINTTETCNIRSITASAHDIWNSYKISSVAVRDNTIVVYKDDLNITMLTVYVEFC